MDWATDTSFLLTPNYLKKPQNHAVIVSGPHYIVFPEPTYWVCGLQAKRGSHDTKSPSDTQAAFQDLSALSMLC